MDKVFNQSKEKLVLRKLSLFKTCAGWQSAPKGINKFADV